MSGALLAPGRQVTLTQAVLKEATAVIIEQHYLHRGRTMAQLAYWVEVDGERAGVMLFALPRLSVTFHGYHPMELLELARLWIDPSVRGQVRASDGTIHADAVAGQAVSRALRRIRGDWLAKYEKMRLPLACVAWADTTRHQGTIYRATNFGHVGRSGGAQPGTWNRPNGGRHLRHADYSNPKAAYLYRWAPPSTE